MGVLISVADESTQLLQDYLNLTDVALRRTLEPAGGLYIAESFKVIERAIRAGHRPRSLLIQNQWADQALELTSGIPDCPIYVVTSELSQRIAGYDIHRGVLASMYRPELPTLDDVLKDARRVVILEDIVDHTNVGAIFRAAAGFGVDAVLVTERCADPLYRRSVRVSMGTVFQVPWTRLPQWSESAEVLHRHGFHMAALALSDDAISLRAFASQTPERVAVVMGTEGDGLTSQALSAVDSTVTIPMMNGVDSLNVASACAVALYALD